MGSGQSDTRNTPQPPQVTEAQVKLLLERQRIMLEEKNREFMAQMAEQISRQAKDSPQTANTAPTPNGPQTANSTYVNSSQTASPPQPANLPQSVYPPLPPYHPQQPYCNQYANSPPTTNFPQTSQFPQTVFPPHFQLQQPSSPQQNAYPLLNTNLPHNAQFPQAGYTQPPAHFPQAFPPQQQHFSPQQASNGPQGAHMPQGGHGPPVMNTPRSATTPEPANSRSTPIPSAPPAPRERSLSRARSSVRTGLKCPTCEAPFGLQIYRCSRGHSSCSDCKDSGRRCRICRQLIINVRNYELEAEIAQMDKKVPCPNKSDGCIVCIKLSEMENHLKKCPFQPQNCPLASIFGNCDWTGKLNQISSHFSDMHPSQHQTNVDTEMRIKNVCSNSREVHLIVLGVYNFVFHLKVSETDRNIYMAAQLIGSKMSAKKWTYEIHLYDKSKRHRKYVFISTCSSSQKSVDNIFKEGSCAVLPFAYATTFINNGALTYKVYIKKNNEVTEPARNLSENQPGKGN